MGFALALFNKVVNRIKLFEFAGFFSRLFRGESPSQEKVYSPSNSQTGLTGSLLRALWTRKRRSMPGSGRRKVRSFNVSREAFSFFRFDISVLLQSMEQLPSVGNVQNCFPQFPPKLISWRIYRFLRYNNEVTEKYGYLASWLRSSYKEISLFSVSGC